MKTKLFLTTIFTLVSNLLFAQQITQTFNFSTDDLHFSQTNGYDIVNLPNTSFLEAVYSWQSIETKKQNIEHLYVKNTAE